MPEFLLRYKIPVELDTDLQIDAFKQQIRSIADEIQSEVSKIFFGWDVTYETREFGDSKGQNNLCVTGWVTDNKDEFVDKAIEAQEKVLLILQKHAFSDQKVDCWWQRVKGKWGEANGLKIRT